MRRFLPKFRKALNSLSCLASLGSANHFKDLAGRLRGGKTPQRAKHPNPGMHQEVAPSAAPVRQRVAFCHSSSFCSAFESLVMQLPASFSVRSVFPVGSAIGSSKGVDQGNR